MFNLINMVACSSKQVAVSAQIADIWFMLCTTSASIQSMYLCSIFVFNRRISAYTRSNEHTGVNINGVAVVAQWGKGGRKEGKGAGLLGSEGKMGTNGSVESHSLGKPNVCGQIVVVFDGEKSTNVSGLALMHRPMEIVPHARTRSLHSTAEFRIYEYV